MPAAAPVPPNGRRLLRLGARTARVVHTGAARGTRAGDERLPSRLMMMATGVPFVAGAPRAAVSRLGTDGEPLRGFEELAPFVADAAVTDVFVAGGRVFVDRGGGAQRTTLELAEARARALAIQLVADGGRHVDEATPCADVRLHDGIRVHVALPPIAVGGTQISIRLPRTDMLGLADLERAGMFAVVPREQLAALVDGRVNVLITGAGGSGKTTLLAALLSSAAPAERIVTIEDVAELRIRHPHVVALQARQANLEGAGEVTMERLVREALRMRPDRLVLGECRGQEVRELLAALNTGHDGGAGTLHANTLDDVPARLEALGALAGLGPAALARQAVSAFGAVVHVERAAAGRRVVAVGALGIAEDRLEMRHARR